MRRSFLINDGWRHRPKNIELDYHHPFCPDWAVVAGANGNNTRLIKPFTKKYPGLGVAAENFNSYNNTFGWRLDEHFFENQYCAIKFPDVGRQDDGDFTWAVWCIPEDSARIYNWIMAKGSDDGNNRPVIGLGIRSNTVDRIAISWDKSVNFSSSAGEYNVDEPMVAFMRYDSSANVVETTLINLLRNLPIKSFSDSSKTWPAALDKYVVLGGYENQSAPQYNEGFNGWIDRAMVWDRYIPDEMLEPIAFNPNMLFRLPFAFLPQAAAGGGGGLSIPVAMYHRRQFNRG